MAKRDSGGTITLSVLDRLIDEDPKLSSEASLSRSQALALLRVGVRRDLEWLLNTRRTIEPATGSARETARSVYNYGFADISSRSVLSSKDHNDIVREMESVLALFEPRLKRVKVRMESPATGTRVLRFSIDGLLDLDPVPEPVRFDTVLQLGTGGYEIKG